MNDSTQQSCGVQGGRVVGEGTCGGQRVGRSLSAASESAGAEPKPATEQNWIESNSWVAILNRDVSGRTLEEGAAVVGVDTYAFLHLNYVKSILF